MPPRNRFVTAKRQLALAHPAEAVAVRSRRDGCDAVFARECKVSAR
jgi:hypothetical protein